MKAKITVTLEEAKRLLTEDFKADYHPNPDFKGDIEVEIELPEGGPRPAKISAIVALKNYLAMNGFKAMPLVDMKQMTELMFAAAGVPFR